MVGLPVTSLVQLRDFKIPAYLASQDGVNLSVAGYCGNLLLAGINIHGVPAAFPQFSASVLFEVPDQFVPLHRAATETDSLRTSSP
jgi:hypothetical protein